VISKTKPSNPQMPGARLRAFRERLFANCGRRADALFEITDSVLATGVVPSTVYLSLAPTHRRSWCSLYAALSKCRIDAEDLKESLALLRRGSRATRVYAVDVSPWPRCGAESSPGRCYLYHPPKHSAGQPIVPGWVYQLVIELGFERDSWVAPVGARRVRPKEGANNLAAEQVAAQASRLPMQEGVPLFVFDAGYDPVRLQLRLEGSRAQILVRLHSGRTFYVEPEVPPKRPVGRPSRHGKKFDCKDLSTWSQPTAEHLARSAYYGSMRVRAWSGLHPKTRRAAERYGVESAAVVKGTVVLVEVERLPRGERRRKPKALWLWWHGPGTPDLDLLWRAYCRRFDVEHFVRFLKQALGWTTPRVRHPEQADLWTRLVLAAYAQLYLTRRLVADRRLPWEQPLPAGSLTPTRVLRNFVSLLPLLGTPAKASKPRGRSPVVRRAAVRAGPSVTRRSRRPRRPIPPRRSKDFSTEPAVCAGPRLVKREAKIRVLMISILVCLPG
jgi:hypothetical protein